MPAFYSLFPTANFTITRKDFNAFHNIDRQLFTSLVLNLGRDTAQSIQVMALWLWYERVGHCRKLVETLLSLPLGVTSAIADEAVIVLRCIEQDQIPPIFENMEIHITRSFARTNISLRYFHRIRLVVISGITQVITDVCTRAFKDVLARPQNDMWSEPPKEEDSYPVNECDIWGSFNYKPTSVPEAPKEEYVWGSFNFKPTSVPEAPKEEYVWGSFNFSVPEPPQEEYVYPGHDFSMFQSRGDFVPYVVPTNTTTRNNSVRAGGGPNIPSNFIPNAARAMGPMWNNQQQYNHHMMEKNKVVEFSRAAENNDVYSYQQQQSVVSNVLSDLFGNINLGFNEFEIERDQVPEDDRTVFLTFSKGYPISELEVKEFFTRRYGNIIDGIYMQEVADDEQVLYARMVVKAVSIIYAILVGRPKAKFTINGKHVWARKYVRKGNNNANASSSQQPTSPHAGTTGSG